MQTMTLRTFDDLLSEISKRLAVHCKKVGDPDCFSGRLMISLNVEEIRSLTAPALLEKVREFFPLGRPSSAFIFTIRDKVLDKKLFLFHYKRESGVWILVDESPNP